MQLISVARQFILGLWIELQELRDLARLSQAQILVLHLGLISSQVTHLLVNRVPELGAFICVQIANNDAKNVVGRIWAGELFD